MNFLMTIFSRVLLFYFAVFVVRMFLRVGYSTCQILLTAAAVRTGIARGSWGPTTPVRESFSCNIANTKLATEYLGSSVTCYLDELGPSNQNVWLCLLLQHYQDDIFCGVTYNTVECYFLHTFLNARFR